VHRQRDHRCRLTPEVAAEEFCVSLKLATKSMPVTVANCRSRVAEVPICPRLARYGQLGGRASEAAPA
jgi:hypothetical protein